VDALNAQGQEAYIIGKLSQGTGPIIVS
jgi:hypothetical protein